MEYVQIIILGIVQGLTEFLPISSSGHLILAPKLLGFEDQGLALDAILHLATLFAIIIFFRDDLLKLGRSLFDGNADPPTRRLAWNILLASIPAGAAGFFWGDWIEHQLRDPGFVAINLLVWSAVFFIADRQGKRIKNPEHDIFRLRLSQVFFVGCAQAIALLPGTSRSGITIAAGLFSKLSPTNAARFSFLLGTPVILAAGVHKMIDLFLNPGGHLAYGAGQLGVGFLVTFAVGYVSIQLLLKIVARLGLLPFIVYRVLLALSILIYFPV